MLELSRGLHETLAARTQDIQRAVEAKIAQFALEVGRMGGQLRTLQKASEDRAREQDQMARDAQKCNLALFGSLKEKLSAES